MAKKVENISQKTTDYILGSVGFIFPRTEKELDNFNRLYSGSEFDLGEYTLNPDKAFNDTKLNSKAGKTKLKFEISKNTYFKRAVLAAEITSHLYSEPTFGSVKLQKLMFLCENIDSMNINFEYSKQAAGPYDNKFMHSIGIEFKRQGWFKVEKVKSGKIYRNVFVPLDKFGTHKDYFNRYFLKYQEKIQWIIDTFRKEKTDRVELIATLYACWMELSVNKRIISDEALLTLLYDWSVEKQKFSRLSAIQAIQWMKENNVAPCEIC